MPLGEIDAMVTQWVTSLGWPLDGFARLALAALCGGLVGFEREIRGRQAGFRTNLLVCVGSAIVMIVSIKLSVFPWRSQGDPHVNINTDPGRIAYSVMSGIGFIGAGTIIHNRGSIRGLTTAAALWCVAALGLSAGFGLYVFTVMSTLIVVVALWVLGYIERLVPHTRFRTITVSTPWSPGCVSAVAEYFKSQGFGVIDSSFDRRENPAVAVVTVDVSFNHPDQFSKLEHTTAHDSRFEILATRETQQ